MKDSEVITAIAEMIAQAEKMVPVLPSVGSERMEEVLVLLREVLDQIIL